MTLEERIQALEARVAKLEGKGKRKHAFHQSPYYNFQTFRDYFPKWSNGKCAEWHTKAVEYSEANGGRYLNWALAVKSWERRQRPKDNGVNTLRQSKRLSEKEMFGE